MRPKSGDVRFLSRTNISDGRKVDLCRKVLCEPRTMRLNRKPPCRFARNVGGGAGAAGGGRQEVDLLAVGGLDEVSVHAHMRTHFT
jgi:hypothetical protein